MKKLHNLIIVDESGSMSSIEKQAVSGMLETLSSIKSSQKRIPDVLQTITLITFNSEHLSTLYNCSLAESVDVDSIRYLPSGCTPLYDAIGTGISRLKEVAQKEDNVIVTIITDGYENSSSRYTLSEIKRMIEQQKELGWTVALIGTSNLDVESMAKSMSINDHLSFSQDAQTTRRMFREMGAAREARVFMAAEDIEAPKGASLFDISEMSSDDVDQSVASVEERVARIRKMNDMLHELPD
ncbi:MAG: VWA domain-containing protein [Bacteroidales bacterium]|nr:VWA domain-containing protein [Bacteroidales bacterium]